MDGRGKVRRAELKERRADIRVRPLPLHFPRQFSHTLVGFFHAAPVGEQQNRRRDVRRVHLTPLKVSRSLESDAMGLMSWSFGRTASTTELL